MKKTITDDELATTLRTLELLANDTQELLNLSDDQRLQLYKVAGFISRPDREESKKRQKLAKQQSREKVKIENRKSRGLTGIRSLRDLPVFSAPLLPEFSENTRKNFATTQHCYVCKATYHEVHHFYDTMCPSCADLNYKKRFQTADLENQVAIITGSRLKIGYQATLMMLRAGATVIATTRFPVDSAKRFSAESDFHNWGHRLQIYGLDLRHTPSVELFCRYIESKYHRLDILINNAAQTVRRPTGFYEHLMIDERKPFFELSTEVQSLLKDHQNCIHQLNTFNAVQTIAHEQENTPVSWHHRQPGLGLKYSAELSQIPYTIDDTVKSEEIFPAGKLDQDLQQVDLRKTNSWRLRLGEIYIPEMLEVQLVNAVAPFVLINHLIHLMRKHFTGQKHIVNVSAMEGKFHRFKKEDRHPHTNMAKAALNMMTHTSALDFAKDGIYMNAVDTGWVTDEDPAHLSQLKQEIHDFQPPLDIVDGAARVLDPIFDGINSKKHWCGKFLKDYFPIDW
jgi:NAD(P)-dependent dehydrogenase (short-subunit alcohol dehydrogenase family)